MRDHWGWICGWGVNPGEFRAEAEKWKPEAIHTVLLPNADAVPTLLNMQLTAIGGYSLGSLLLMKALPEFPQDLNILCLAPILSFTKGELGGKTSATTLTKLKEKLILDPQSAYRIFHRLSGITPSFAQTIPTDSTDNLAWGLDQLSEVYLSPKNKKLRLVSIVVGSNDRLLDYKKLICYFKNARLTDSSHCFRSLFKSLQTE